MLLQPAVDNAFCWAPEKKATSVQNHLHISIVKLIAKIEVNKKEPSCAYMNNMLSTYVCR
jgi:hypothetical protein